jgi:chromosome segregation ATPase
MAARELQRAFKDAQSSGDNLAKELDSYKKALGETKDVPEEVKKKVEEFQKKWDELKKEFSGGWEGPEFAIMDLAGQLQASTTAPTEAQLRSVRQLTEKLAKNIEKLNALLAQDFAQLRDLLDKAGVLQKGPKPIEPPKIKE